MIYEVTSVSLQGLGAGQDEPIDVSTNTDFVDTGSGFFFSPTEAQYVDGTYPPGTYDVVIKGTSTLSGDEEEVTVQMTLVDPCDPPVSVSVGVLENQGDYTPTQTDFPNY